MSAPEYTKPTYGELIDLLEEATDPDELRFKFSALYPHIKIGRRFHDTVCRIAAPTKLSLTGKRNLTGSQLASYRRRIWEPRIRNRNSDGELAFPTKLLEYGLNEEILSTVFKQVSNGETELEWSLQMQDVTPTTDFYRQLHLFLKRSSIACHATKTAIGRFYMAIDEHLCYEGVRPDNVYRFIQTTAEHEGDGPIKYHKDKVAVSVSSNSMQENAQDIEALHAEVIALKKQLNESRKELRSTQSTLKEATNKAQVFKTQRDSARNKVRYYKGVQSVLLEDLVEIEEEYSDLSEEMAALEQELESTASKLAECPQEVFTIETKCGRRYSPAIRKLYYTLLAKAVPTSEITEIVKEVVKSFNPSIDVQKIKLPKKACASYMRKDELKTVSAAHKATVLCEHAAKKVGFKLNTDGTTKNLKKIGAVGINDVVIAVNELPSGTADAAIADISHELEKLRSVAHELKISNASSINWTLFVTTTSDSAASQKKLNHLIEDLRLSDEEVYGSADSATIDLIESFCSMHLAVNLRKAFLNGMHIDSESSSTTDRYYPSDTLVHEFCKLFGRYGVPEYGCGISFNDFLLIKATDSDLDENVKKYYHDCSIIRLERQVGSRYFVTAANAMKIVFLRDAAIEFLNYTGREKGTKLEKDVHQKLLDEEQIAFLKVDALMFYHVYADLVILSKSTELNKSVLDMNQHYLELKLFLEEVELRPDIILKMNVAVFKSEVQLYNSSKTNHRNSSGSESTHTRLFKECNSTLFKLVVPGVTKMKEKLCIYAKSNLPGGMYWEPSDVQIKKVLSELRPTNDFCESILGLNDHLTTVLPNLHQVARSNLIEVKKNKTVKWLDELAEEQQLTVIDLAVKRREAVKLETRLLSEQIDSERRERLVQNHKRQEALKRKKEIEKDKLSQIHLITSTEELLQLVDEIEKKSTSATKKKQELRMLLNNQVKLRQKILGQDIHIKFSHSGKQRPLPEITDELSHFIDQHSHELSSFISNPSTLVGRQISHKFELEETSEMKWYTGSVVDYDYDTKTHKVLYDGEENYYYFDLTMDIINGDLIIH